MSLRVSVVSESEFMAKGHGVHTAYIELTQALERLPEVEVTTNKKASADITHLHTVGVYALYRLLFDRSKKVVSAHIVPASLVGSLIGARFWLPLAQLYLRWFYNRADLVFAVSDETKRTLLAMGVKKPIEIVYNVIDTSRYHAHSHDKAAARRELGFDANAWVVIGAGQVQPRKRLDSFVGVASQLPGMQFVWVGGMPFGKLAAENAAMQRLIDNPSPNVTFTGSVELEAMKQYYHASDVFWLPSEQETFGLVVVEAAAAGLPIVLRDIPDYAETFADDALLVRDEDTVGMLEMLQTDAAFYTQAKARAAHIAERYDASAGAKRVIDIYESLLS